MVYLDYNSTTPTDRRVIDSMIPVFEEKFGNPASEGHHTGRVARELVEQARMQVANAVGMTSSDTIFTSGATEANNTVIYGIAGTDKQAIVLIGATEHKSILEPCKAICDTRFKTVPVVRDGTLDLKTLENMLINKDVRLVSVMVANSETGVLHPIKKVVEMVHDAGALIHCDATQAVGKIPFDAGELDIDIVTFSSHKIYGPKGCGALVATRHARKMIRPLLHGGGQEKDMRSGTLNVPGVVGFGVACELATGECLGDAQRQQRMRDDFERRITQEIPDITINGKGAARLPNTSNIRIAGALADAVMLNAKSIEISTGSACSSSTMESSHVLLAMGLDRNAADESVRISVGRPTIESDIDVVVADLTKAAMFVRSKEGEISAGG